MRSLMFSVFLAFASISAQADDVPFAAFDHAGPEVLNDPHDLAFGPDDRLYVADKFGSRIAVLDPETLDVIEVIGAGKLPGVHDISFGPNGRAAIAVTGASAVLIFNQFDGPDAQPVALFPASRTEGALVHSNGKVYATAGGTGGVIAYTNENDIKGIPAGHFGAHDIAEDPDGNIWVADNFNRRLVKYSAELERLQVLDHEKYGFAGPRYLDIDEFGRLIVADQDAHRVLMIDPDGPDGGTLLGVLGSGLPGKGPNLFDDPEGVAVRGNRYFISDSDNNRVVRYIVVTN